MKVLFWDDLGHSSDQTFVTVFSRHMQNAGFTIISTNNIDDIPVEIAHNSFDIVISDVFLKSAEEGKQEAVGVDIAKKVLEYNKHIPVFLITGQIGGINLDEVDIPLNVPIMKKSDARWLATDIKRHLMFIGKWVDRKKVFLIYGRDEGAIGSRDKVREFLRDKGLNVVELDESRSTTDFPSTLIEDMRVCAAIIAICTPDDKIANDFYQPRQNVLLEVGMALATNSGLSKLNILQLWGDEPDKQANLPSDLGTTMSLRFKSSISDVFPTLIKRLRKQKVEI